MVVKAVAQVLAVLQERLGQSPVQSRGQPDPADEEVSGSGGQRTGTPTGPHTSEDRVNTSPV